MDEERLLTWYSACGRHDLPWRQTRDPYAVLVSEVMLQQTQVSRVEPAWSAWLERWPDARSLARAATSDVIRAWSGMGYNRRAVHLHAAAGAVVERHGGVVPTDVAALERLPGVGPYTARAVASFAGERPVAVVDTNIGRVIARSDFGVARAAGAGSKALWLAADAAIPAEGGRARHRNLALMDLGALVCQARAPACDRCPLLGGCAWTASGKPRPKAQARRSQPFESTGRYARGRIVELLRIRGAATAEEIAAALPEGHRGAVGAYLAALERDSLVTCEQGTVRLGGATGG